MAIPQTSQLKPEPSRLMVSRCVEALAQPSDRMRRDARARGHQAQPNASVLNAFQGQTVTNFTIVPAGTLGQLNVYAYRRTDVVVEVNGYFAR